jgi:hypothetical protein
MVKFLVGLVRVSCFLFFRLSSLTLFLQQDINLNLVNSFGETPLDLCKSIPESKEVEAILRAAGAKWGSSIVKKDVVDAAEGGFILAARLGRLDFVHKALMKVSNFLVFPFPKQNSKTEQQQTRTKCLLCRQIDLARAPCRGLPETDFPKFVWNCLPREPM